MSNSRRDNFKAKRKAVARGVDVRAKRSKRKSDKIKCDVCGGLARPKKIEGGMCKMCKERCVK